MAKDPLREEARTPAACHPGHRSTAEVVKGETAFASLAITRRRIGLHHRITFSVSTLGNTRSPCVTVRMASSISTTGAGSGTTCSTPPFRKWRSADPEPALYGVADAVGRGPRKSPGTTGSVRPPLL